MGNMARLRITVDAMVDSDKVALLNRHIQKQIQENSWVLVNTAGFAEAEGIDPSLRVERVVTVHQHDSTDDYSCPSCRQMSQDGWNSNNGLRD